MGPFPDRATMTRAFLESDSGFEGVFWTGVRTTGIFCRTTCPARKAKAENLEFFPSIAEAIHAGYRPCRRCHPLEPFSGGTPPWVQAILDRVRSESTGVVGNKDLEGMGINPARARRWFLSHYGMTLSAFQRSERMQRAFHALRAGSGIDAAALDHGYESVSGFREAFRQCLGATPGRIQTHGGVIASRIMDTPLGPVIIGADDVGICWLEFAAAGQLPQQIANQHERAGLPVVPASESHPIVDRAAVELLDYFSGSLRRFSVPLHLRGTPFQRSVWAGLCEIPYGTTESYAGLAGRLGKPGAMRAVGLANGANPIAILVPCHRVVNASGELGGYGGGLWRKRWLLAFEQRSAGQDSTGSTAVA